MRLRNKVAIVTGAGSGMGRAGAELFAREGAKVVVADIHLDRAQETVKAIKSAGGEATAVEVDVRRVADLERMVQTALAEYKTISILWNHAGRAGPAGIETVEESEIDEQLAAHVKSSFLACKFAVPVMKRDGGGAILVTSSATGVVGSPTSPLYSVVKGAQVMLAKSFALALAPFNIRVNALCPGTIETPMVSRFFSGLGAGTVDPTAARKAFLSSSVPLGRTGKPEEVAQAALFLVSDEASYITGVALPVDGGFLAR